MVVAYNRPMRQYVSQTLEEVLKGIPVYEQSAAPPVCDRTDLDLDWASRRYPPED